VSAGLRSATALARLMAESVGVDNLSLNSWKSEMDSMKEDAMKNNAAKVIDRAAFEEYVRRFNSRDYDGVMEYWHSNFTVEFAGYTFHNREEFIDKFYKNFFHRHVNESLHIDAFITNEDYLFIEVRVHLEGKMELTREQAEAAGFGRLQTPPVGKTLEIPQFIHYHVKDGKFVSVVCAISGEPRVL